MLTSPKVLRFRYLYPLLWLLLLTACGGPSDQSGQADDSAAATADATLTPDPVTILFDTDCGPDYDDVGAMAMLHAFADRGEARILGTVSSNLHPLVGPSIDVLNTYFGRPDLPIGAPKTAGVNLNASQKWTDTLVARYPHKLKATTDAPDAVAVYRRLLAAQPDSSVTVVTVGFLTNVRNLLASKPDSLSPLDGKALVKQKVKQWVAMAGKFPEGKEFNIEKDSAASRAAIDGWPTPILFSGFEIGEKVKTGLRLIKEGDPGSPVRKVFAISIPKAKEDKDGRMSWDQTAVLVAVRGAAPFYDTQRGRFLTRPDGSNGWQDDSNGPHIRLVQKMAPDSVAREIETLMMHRPNQAN
jgi:inosine-uridine nucleoside N-ribohydrolase